MCIELRHEATAETSFHMPDSSPLWRSMQVARPHLHAEGVGLDDRIVEQLVEAEVPRLHRMSVPLTTHLKSSRILPLSRTVAEISAV